jgi:hypothetical protein
MSDEKSCRPQPIIRPFPDQSGLSNGYYEWVVRAPEGWRIEKETTYVTDSGVLNLTFKRKPLSAEVEKP